MFVNRVRALVAGIVCGLTSMVMAQVPVGTAFTYQGELRQQGAVVTSTADMRFRLFDAATGGNQIGPELQLLSGTVSKGHFTVELDFGATAFGPNARWLEVVLRTPAGPGTSYTTLTPRQRITPAPVALYALSGNAGAAGPTGPVGPQGLQGPPGVQGQTGSQGVAGPGGPAGPAGPQGAMGPTGLTGSQGSTGAAGLSWRGIWSPQSNYALNDAILDNGSSYRCIAAPNVGNPPATSPGLWQLVASVGSPGATGSTGPVGAQGSTGPQGLPGQAGVPGVPGTQGPQGEPGNTGPTGTGQQGPPGISGATGATGVAGPTGASFTQFVVGQDPADPYQTVQSAVAAAQLAGGPQLVYVKPGLYQENIDITGPDITLRGSGVSSTVVLGTLRVSPSPNSAGKRVSKIDSFTIKTSVENGVTVTSPGPVDVSFSDFTVDTTGPVVTCMRVDCPGGGRVSYRLCTCPAGCFVSGSSLSMDAVDSRFSSVQCESSRLRLSNCLITSVTVPCLSLSSGAQCECVSSWMGRSSGTSTPDCAVVSSGSSLTCRSCVTVGRFACDASSLRLESCDSSNPTGVCCDLSSGGTCVATSSRLSGGGGGAGGSVCVSVSSSSSMTCTGCECTGQFDCVGGALHLASSSFRDYDSDDDGVLDIRSGGTCDVVSCVIDSGRATGGRVAVACNGALSSLDMSGCVSYGSLECSAIAPRSVLKSYFETGDRPTVAQRGGAVLRLSGCTLVRSPGALTNGMCMSIDGQDTDTDCSSCQVSGSVSVTGGSRVSFHSSSITTLSLPCLSEVGSAAELDFCTLSSGGAPTDGRCVVASGGHVSLSRCELYGGEQCDDGATVTNDGCTIRCVAAPCVTVSATSHALLHSGAMLTSSSPAVSSAQGGDVRFGVVTYLGSGGGMPPTAVALPVENVAQLVTVQVQQFSGPVSMTNPSNVFGGNGAALSSLSASALSSGTVPDSRLSTSVVRTNAPNVFSFDQTFTQVMHAQGGVEFSDGSVQQTAARPPLSRFTVGKDPGDAFTSVQAAVTAAEAAGGPQVVVLKPGTFAGDVTITSPDITLWGVSAHGATPSTILGQLRLSTNMSVGKPMLTWCVRVQVTDNRPAVVMDGPSPLFVEMRDVVVSSSAPVTGPLMVISPSSSTGGGSGRVSMSRCTVDGRLYMAGGAELSFVGVDDDCDSFTCEGGSLHLSSSRLTCSSGVCVDALSGAVVSLDSCTLRGTSGGVGALTQVVRLDATSSVSCDSCDCTGELLCVGGTLRLTGGTYNDPDTDGDSLVAVTQGGRVTAISACFRDRAGNMSPVFSVSSGSTCTVSCCPTCRIDNSPTNRPVVLCDGTGSSCEISGSPCVGSVVSTGGGKCVLTSSSFVTLDAPALQVTSARCRASDCRFSSSPTGALTDAVCFSLQGQETDVDCGGCTIDGRVVVSGGVVLTPRLRLSTCAVRSLSLPCLAVSGGDEDCDGCAFTVGSGSPTDALCVSATGGASLHLSSCLVVGSEECDDGNLVNDDCLMRCVSAPCVSVGASGHAAVRTCTLQTSASPLVAVVQGGELRYGLVTSGGSGSGMPPGAVALVIQNLPMLTTPDLQSFSGPLAMTNPSNVLGGNGAALTSLDASHITTGVLADSHFPPSVVRTTASNVFTSDNTFTQPLHLELGMQFGDGSVQTTAARPPLSRFTVGKDPGDAFTSVQAAVDAAEAAGGPQVVMVKPGVYAGDVLITGSDIRVQGTFSDGRSDSVIEGSVTLRPSPNAQGRRLVALSGMTARVSTGVALLIDGSGAMDVSLTDVSLVRLTAAPSAMVVITPASLTLSSTVTLDRCHVSGGGMLMQGRSLSVRVTDSDCDEAVACVGSALQATSCRFTCTSGTCIDVSQDGRVDLVMCRTLSPRLAIGAVPVAMHVSSGSSLTCTGGSCGAQVQCDGGSCSFVSMSFSSGTNAPPALLVTGGGTCLASSCTFESSSGQPSSLVFAQCSGGSRCEFSGVTSQGALTCDGSAECVARSSTFTCQDASCLTVSHASFTGTQCAFTRVDATGPCVQLTGIPTDPTDSDCDLSSCTVSGQLVCTGCPLEMRSTRITTSQPVIVENSRVLVHHGYLLDGADTPVDSPRLRVTGALSDVTLQNCVVYGTEECDDSGRITNDGCAISTVSAPCITVSPTSSVSVSSSLLRTSSSPVVLASQGAVVRYGLVTYSGTGTGMPPLAIPLQIENVPALSSSSPQTFSGPLTLTNPSNLLGGNGAALTSLDASHISSGTLDEARLPSSLVRVASPNVFTSSNTFTQPLHAEGGVTFSDGSVQTTAASPPLSRFIVGKDPGDAFSSIQAAVSAAELAGGGTVFVKPGVYTEDVTITKSNIVVSSSSSRDNRTYVGGHFHIEVDGVSGGYLSSRVVVQGLEIAPVSGPAMVLAGQSLCEVVVSDCKLTCASGTCMSVDLQGVDTSGRHTPFHVSRCTISSSSGQAPALALLSGEGRLAECQVSCPVDGVAMSCALGAVTKQYVDSCDFSGRVQCTGSGACVMTRCSVSLSASSQTDSVALALSGSCDMSCRDCTVSGGRVDSSGSSRLYMSGGKVLVAGGLDAVRLTVQARDRFDNVQMSGRLFVTDSSTCDLSRCALSVASGAGATCDASCRVTFHECFLTARVECSGTCVCDVRASTISVPSGDCFLASASSKVNLSGGTMTGTLRVSGSSSCDATSCSISNPGGDCVVSSNQGTVRFSGSDFEGRVHVTDSVSFSFQKCEFSNALLSCMLADEDCDGVCSDCTFRGSVTSVGRKQKQWLCSNFRFSGDCLTIGEECDDSCSTCTFDGRVLLSGTAHSSFTDCAFSSTGQCVSSLDHHQSSFSSCRKNGQFTAADFSRTTMQGCTFTSPLQCLVLSGSSDCVCSGTTFSGPVSLGGQSTSRLVDDHLLLGLHVYESAHVDCFSDTIDSALNLQDDGIASFRSSHLSSSSGPCVTMTGASSVSLYQCQLDSPPGSLAIQAPPTASVRVAQLVLSTFSILPPQTTAATVVDPIDSNRLVDGSVSTVDLALSSVDSSRLAVDSSSLSRVSGGSLQASSTPAGSSIVLSSSSLFLFGGQDVSLYRGGSSLLHLDGALESSLGLQALGGDVVVHSGRVLSSDGAVLGGGGGGGGSGGSVRVSAVGDLDMDGSLDVAVGALHVSSSLQRVGINELLPDAKLHVTGTATERAAHFSSSSSTQSALISEVTLPAAQVSAIEGVSHSPLLEGAAIRGRNDSLVGQSVGVLGESHSQQGFGVFSIGNTGATGLKSFYIDHPLDPANKFLRHYSAEGPEALNIYRGTVILNASGEAVVSLPEYFEALNKDFDYQLTCVGGFAPVFIAEEVRNNAFKISGGRAGLKVCWTVTGVRNDAFAKSSTPAVEEAKPASLRGKYLHPELFNAAPDKAIFLNVESAAGGLAQTRKN